MGDIIGPEELDSFQDMQDLKDFLSDEISQITYEMDEEDIEKVKNLTAELKEKYSNNQSVEEKVEDIRTGFYQRFKHSFEHDLDIDPGRLLGLTDGIFGMVMTLLVFGIAIPELTSYTYENFLSTFLSMLPTIGVTIVSFVIISSFWIYHHEYIKLKNLNILYLWLNILFLISLSFIPFTTSLIGAYSEFFASEVVFGINILISIILFLLMYIYATKNGFLERKPSKQEKNHVVLTLGSIMGLTIIVNLLDFNISSKFIYLFLLIPIVSTILDTWYHYKHS